MRFQTSVSYQFASLRPRSCYLVAAVRSLPLVTLVGWREAGCMFIVRLSPWGTCLWRSDK